MPKQKCLRQEKCPAPSAEQGMTKRIAIYLYSQAYMPAQECLLGVLPFL